MADGFSLHWARSSHLRALPTHTIKLTGHNCLPHCAAAESPNAIEIYECIINGLKLEAEAEVRRRRWQLLRQAKHPRQFFSLFCNLFLLLPALPAAWPPATCPTATL